MTTILRASDPASLLGMIPPLAGYTPRESLVLLPFTNGRCQGAARIDLPHTDDLDGYVHGIHRVLAQLPDCDRMAIAVYTDEVSADESLPHAALLDALISEIAQRTAPIEHAFCVTPQGWADALDEAPQLRPLAEIPHPSGFPSPGDQYAGSELPEVDNAEAAAVADALGALQSSLHETDLAAELVRLTKAASVRGSADLTEFGEQVLSDGEVSPSAWALVLWCLRRAPIRDALLVQWASDIDTGREALRAQQEFAVSGQLDAIPPQIGELFIGQAGTPEPDRLTTALHMCRHAAARAPWAFRAGALVTCAWLAWALGRSTHASEYVRRAQETDPDLSFAALVEGMLDAGYLPTWVTHHIVHEAAAA